MEVAALTILTYTLIGGNDVGLVDILNQCIYQWASFSKFQAAVAKLDQLKHALSSEEASWFAGFDWDKLSRTCDEQLDASQALIDGSAFSNSLDEVLAAAKTKLSSELVATIFL